MIQILAIVAFPRRLLLKYENIKKKFKSFIEWGRQIIIAMARLKKAPLYNL